MGPDAAFGVCRFVHDTSAMLAWGAAGYVAALAPPDLADALGRRLRAYLTVVGLGGVLSILAALPPFSLPRSLRLEDQGEFAIGYYHQRKARLGDGKADLPALADAEQEGDATDE